MSILFHLSLGNNNDPSIVCNVDNDNNPTTNYDTKTCQQKENPKKNTNHDNTTTTTTTETSHDESFAKCNLWAKQGECENSPQHMQKFCPEACHQLKDNTCVDTRKECIEWSEGGECSMNPVYMLKNCRKSCSVCEIKEFDHENDSTTMKEEPCENNHENCEKWANRGECEKNPNYMFEHCSLSCRSCLSSITKETDFGVKQLITGVVGENSTQNSQAIARQSIKYMKRVMTNIDYAKVRKQCLNKDERCSYWAASGNCKDNSTMWITCGPACHKCEMIDIERRCPFDSNTASKTNTLKSGDLYRLFERIVEKKEKNDDPLFQSLSPNILYRPYHNGKRNGNYKWGPWFIEFDTFLTPEECDYMIAYASNQKGFQSTTKYLSLPNNDGSGTDYRPLNDNDPRGAKSTRCGMDCYEDIKIRTILNRIATVIGMPDTNSEYLQFVKYEKGQLYPKHTDYIKNEQNNYEGVRVLTMILFLNDVVAGGGGSEFFEDSHSMNIIPKQGKAILFPNVQNMDPNEYEPIFIHESYPVLKGVKYVANAWFHIRDFKGPKSKNCVRESLP